MEDRQQGGKRPSNRSSSKKKKSTKIKAPFFPNSPTSVGSPKDDGSRFYPRRVNQRTPKKLCTLVLPPPLISLFDNSSGHDAATTSATVRLTAASDNASLDGLSILENNTLSHAPASVRHSSNASAVSASVASVGGVGSSGSSVHNPHLPLHLRVGMAPCDPLLVFDGKFALVGTCDGRVAIYSIVDFESGVSDDVKASERRRRADWKEDDETEQNMRGGEKKDNKSSANNNPPLDAEEVEEESEWEMRDRMHRREKAKQTVEPILILPLPRKNHGFAEDDTNRSNPSIYDEESTINAPVNIATPPTIVAMCATPGSETSLIEQRDLVHSSNINSIAEDPNETLITRSQTFRPSFGKDLLGHVAVLTDDGEVHVLEFHRSLAPLIDLQEESEAGDTFSNGMNTNHIPIVNFVLSFRTGHLSATTICIHGLGCQQQPHSTTESVCTTQQMRLCIGHHSGIIATFQIYSECIYPEVKKVSSSPKDFTSPGKYAKTDPPDGAATRNDSHEKSIPSSPSATHSRSKTTDFQDIGLSNMHSTPGEAAPRPLAFQRTLSEPISASDIQIRELTPDVGPANVELCWQGKFDVPIRSLSNPGWGSPGKEEEQIECALLVVGLEIRQSENSNQDAMHAMAPSVPHYSLSPAISLEVVNSTLAENYWCKIKSGPGPSKECISLYDCSVWPAAGKEIKDGWTRGSSHRRVVDPRDKLYGMLGVQRTSVTNQICCFEGSEPCFVAASSDGTVTISHHRSKDGLWGVMEENNQIMFCQRCIGIGTVDYGVSLKTERRYAVCCLRGGTIYMVPVGEPAISKDEMEQNDITMFAVPMDPDGDDDGLVRFVQNFTGGMAHVVCWKDQVSTDKSHPVGAMPDGTMKPVAMVGWPGGNIDVYDVAPERKSSTDIFLEEIIERGMVTKLVQRLLDVSKSHPLISSDVWRRAWDECHEVTNLDGILKGIKDTSTEDFLSMRLILLNLTQ